MQKQFWWIAPCGIDCSKCSIHRRTEEELAYWKEKGVDLSLIRCDGCRPKETKITGHRIANCWNAVWM